MAHFDFARPGGQWPAELAPGASDYQRWDANQAKFIDGDDGGGSFSPTSPIIVGGAGMDFSSAGTLFSGGVNTKTGGRAQLANVANNTPTCPATLQQVLVSLVEAEATIADLSLPTSWLADDYISVISSPLPVGSQSIVGGRFSILPIPGRCLHQGAVLSGLGLSFRVTTRPPATGWTPPALAYALIGFNPSTNTPFTVPSPPVLGWLATTAYELHSYVVPTATHTTGLYYKATTVTGHTGVVEPVWPTVIGGTVVDGAVTWTAVGFSGQLPATSSAANYYNDGKPQSIAFTGDPVDPISLDATGQTHYGLLIGGLLDVPGSSTPLVNIELHQLLIIMSGITTLGFE